MCWGAANRGFKRWGFKQIGGYLRKEAFFLRFLDFPGALVLFRPSKRAEKGRKRPISADFGRLAARHPVNPHLLHPHLRQPKCGDHLDRWLYRLALAKWSYSSFCPFAEPKNISTAVYIIQSKTPPRSREKIRISRAIP